MSVTTGDKVVEQNADETVIAGRADKASSKSKKTVSVSKPKSRMLFVLLLCIAAIIGGLLFTGQLQPLYESVTTDSVIPPAQHQAERKAIVASAGQQLVPPALRAAKTPMHPVRPSMPRQPNHVVQSANKELNDLLFSIDGLRTAMWRLEASQQTLQNSLLEQQQMNLQVRLRWIINPASRLQQMQLAWEEISLLPGLSERQRQQAIAMHILARTNVQHVKQWQDELNKWADALSTPVHQDILPNPNNRWLAWIVGQFQLRQAPSQEARRLANLRNRLLDAARQLTLESWPQQGVWQRLYAELLLHIKAMQLHHDHGADELAIVTHLPADFMAIQTDIMALRQAAQQWGEYELQGEAL